MCPPYAILAQGEIPKPYDAIERILPVVAVPAFFLTGEFTPSVGVTVDRAGRG